MPITVFDRNTSSHCSRLPSVELRTDRTACPEAKEYHRLVVANLREEYGEQMIGSPPGGLGNDSDLGSDSDQTQAPLSPES